MGQDTLDLFQLGRGDHIPDKQEPEKDLFISLDNLIKSATLGWRTLYEDTALDIQMPKTFFARKVLIKRPLAFKRVLRVLLHNAFRHGRQREMCIRDRRYGYRSRYPSNHVGGPHRTRRLSHSTGCRNAPSVKFAGGCRIFGASPARHRGVSAQRGIALGRWKLGFSAAKL